MILSETVFPVLALRSGSLLRERSVITRNIIGTTLITTG